MMIGSANASLSALLSAPPVDRRYPSRLKPVRHRGAEEGRSCRDWPPAENLRVPADRAGRGLPNPARLSHRRGAEPRTARRTCSTGVEVVGHQTGSWPTCWSSWPGCRSPRATGAAITAFGGRGVQPGHHRRNGRKRVPRPAGPGEQRSRGSTTCGLPKDKRGSGPRGRALKIALTTLNTGRAVAAGELRRRGQWCLKRGPRVGGNARVQWGRPGSAEHEGPSRRRSPSFAATQRTAWSPCWTLCCMPGRRRPQRHPHRGPRSSSCTRARWPGRSPTPWSRSGGGRGVRDGRLTGRPAAEASDRGSSKMPGATCGSTASSRGSTEIMPPADRPPRRSTSTWPWPGDIIDPDAGLGRKARAAGKAGACFYGRLAGPRLAVGGRPGSPAGYGGYGPLGPARSATSERASRKLGPGRPSTRWPAWQGQASSGRQVFPGPRGRHRGRTVSRYVRRPASRAQGPERVGTPRKGSSLAEPVLPPSRGAASTPRSGRCGTTPTARGTWPWPRQGPATAAFAGLRAGCGGRPPTDRGLGSRPWEPGPSTEPDVPPPRPPLTAPVPLAPTPAAANPVANPAAATPLAATPRRRNPPAARDHGSLPS